jgi:subtilase family serine protease
MLNMSVALATVAAFAFSISAAPPGRAVAAMPARYSVPQLAYSGPTRDLAPGERGIAAYVPRMHSDVRDFGSLAPNAAVHVGFLMQVRNKAQLEALTLAQSNRKSPYYHHYLTPAQYDAYFAPTPESIAQTIRLLQRRGFRITQTLPNRSMIDATATAATAQRYFSTSLHAVYQQRRGVRYTNVTPAILPAELRGTVASVSGLHSVVLVHHPLHFGDKTAIARSAAYAAAMARVNAARAAANAAHMTLAQYDRITARHRLTVPPIGTSTPAPGSEPVPTPENVDTDYLNYYAYGPPVFAEGYDYPLMHGYGGFGHAAGSVIDVDYLDSDMNTEYATFLTPAGIKRTGTTSPVGYRVCADPNATAKCDGTIGAGDADGESTLDATAILTEAPYADFYEFIAPAFDDVQIETAYALAVSQDKVDAVNSSFGGCETDDPAFEYAASYIAMEGASLGITFSASSGDTGGYSCGTYASNGVPQTFKDVSTPAAANYFVGVGGTSYLQITPAATNDYQEEIAWQNGGGGASVLEAIPSWQLPVASAATTAGTAVGPSTTFRNVPDVSMVADPGTNPDGFVGGVIGAGLAICHNGTITDSGGTSLASPMFIAMQTDINDAQKSRNGFVNPALYAIAGTSTTEYDFAFHDIILGENLAYVAGTGYDDATGIGSTQGFELAGAPEYGTPGGATPIPQPATTPTAEPTT